ncbi:MAG TPA: FtsX-like permease family protein [Chloroflexota bacterium]|nr:FtsX-like permease family protein [Chloroflexota bacterium]
MRLRLYWSYVTRSLRRGGQRTVLAAFCIAVGVMAIVALQLASQMISNNLTGNVRAANGGDVSARQPIAPFVAGDLAYFTALKRSGKVTDVTGVFTDRGVARYRDQNKDRIFPVTVGVVDPQHYPLVGRVDITTPAGASLGNLLARGDAAVVSTDVASYLRLSLGDRLTLTGGEGQSLTVRVAGLLNASRNVGNGEDMYVQRAAYQKASDVPLGYSVFYMTTQGDAEAHQVAEAIKHRYPLATVETVADALKSRQQQTTQIHQLLQVVGILALLIGGFGVVNTMNVMLARRRLEIAMLKTVGYRRRDLYVLFGLEALLLGLAGGVAGAVVGIGLSWVVKTLLERAFQLQLTFAVDPAAVLMGIGVGVVTAVIFGLQPIVRAAAIRPLSVLRDSADAPTISSRILGGLLFVVLSVLFCGLASFILESVIWGVAVVYGTFAILGVLSLGFAGLVWLVSKLPVPERLGAFQVLISTAALIVALGIAVLVPGIGVLLVLVSLLGYVVAFFPGPLKSNIKMALRNLGRRRARATMTLLALFVGVFSVGLIVILGQDIRDKLNTAIASTSTYNVATLVPARYTGEVDRQLHSLKGLKSYHTVNAAQSVPEAVNGRPLWQYLQGSNRNSGQGNLGLNGTVAFLSGLSGYRLGHQSTDTTVDKGNGRNLTAADSGTANVLVNSLLHTLGPLRLKLGDRITLLNEDRSQRIDVTVVGFYTSGFINTMQFEPIVASRELVHRFGGAREAVIYTLNVDPAHIDAAVTQLNRSASHALTISLASLGTIVDQILGNLITLLVTLAALALFAGIIIIANAVGLAMLERRREQGILKSVGYTSRDVLSGVLIENGVIGGLGGILAMTLVAVATTVLAKQFFKTDLGLPAPTILGLILLVMAIALVTSTLVAWGAVRVRPLEVLRYE